MHQLFRNPLVPLSFFLAILFGTFLYALTLLPAVRTPISSSADIATLRTSETTVRAFIADSDVERKRGLSGRPNLVDGTGMLFVFKESGEHGIWMKDMRFPIDILWLDERLRVVSIKEDARPESYPEVFRSSLPARYVLEVPEGFARKHTIVVGSEFSIEQ